MTAKTSTENIKEAAHGHTAPHTMSHAHATEAPAKAAKPTLEQKSPFDYRMDLMEARVAHLEAVIQSWHDTYQWPLPDGITVATKQAAAPTEDKSAA